MIRDKKHIKFINTLPCVSCFNLAPSECSHIRRKHDGGMGIKPSDNLSVPQCRDCHSKVDFIINSENCDKYIDLANKLYTISGDKDEAVREIIKFRRMK